MAITSGLLTANLKKTKICMNKKLSCFVFEQLCGPSKNWNLSEMVKFFVDLTKDLPEPWRTTRSVVSVLLQGQNVNLILALVEPLCPDQAKHCGNENKKKRSISSLLELGNFEATDLVSEGGLKGRIGKRAVDPLQMMGMFNRMLCNEEVVVAIAEYYHKNYNLLQYSRVWPAKNISPIWCCLVENMEELYRKTPES